MEAHGHKNLLDENELCTDLKCPCGELGMSQEEIDLVDNVCKEYSVVVQFEHDDAGLFGDVVLIWELGALDVGWNTHAAAVKAADWYQKGAIREPRLIRRVDPQLSQNRKSS